MPGISERYYDDSEGAPAQGVGFAPNFSTPMQRGTSPLECWYSGVVNQSAYSTQLYSVDTLFFMPVVVGRSGMLDRIAFEVTTVSGAGGVARCGIYKATSKYNIYPSSLVIDGGSIATDGSTGVKSTTINTFIQAGLYWFGVFCGVSAPTLRRTSTGANLSPMLGVVAALGGSPNSELTAALAYQALPATFPAGGTLQNIGVNDPAAVHVRFSS